MVFKNAQFEVVWCDMLGSSPWHEGLVSGVAGWRYNEIKLKVHGVHEFWSSRGKVKGEYSHQEGWGNCKKRSRDRQG